MENIKIEYIPIKDLKPYEKNARHHEDYDISQIMVSIKKYGFNDPVGIWSDENIIVEGHGRVLAGKKLKMREVPCIRLDHLTDEERREYCLIHNKTAELSEWDFDLLAEDVPSLDFSDFDIDWGLPEEEETVEEIIEDEVPDVPEEVKSQLGDLWILGGHRLICGDSTDVAVIDRLMDGVKADMVFTDPPYGVAYTGGMKVENGKIKSNGKKQIKNDALDYDNLYQFLYDAFINLKVHTKEKSAVYVFYSTNRSREFLNAFYDAGLKQRSIIAWHKTGGGFGDFMAHYMSAYEPCIYGSNGESVNWYGASNEKTVWEINKEKKCDLHPTMKPIELVGRAVKNSSKKDDVVLDCFGGSGSTLIACEQLNRKCYMAELDERYVSVIVNRWLNFTGRKDEIFCIRDGQKLTYDEVFN